MSRPSLPLLHYIPSLYVYLLLLIQSSLCCFSHFWLYFADYSLRRNYNNNNNNNPQNSFVFISASSSLARSLAGWLAASPQIADSEAHTHSDTDTHTGRAADTCELSREPSWAGRGMNVKPHSADRRLISNWKLAAMDADADTDLDLDYSVGQRTWRRQEGPFPARSPLLSGFSPLATCEGPQAASNWRDFFSCNTHTWLTGWKLSGKSV